MQLHELQKHYVKPKKPDTKRIITVDPWTMWGLGVLILCAVENPRVTLQLAIHIYGSTSTDPTKTIDCVELVHISRKRSTYKWTCAVQTRVVQGSTIYEYSYEILEQRKLIYSVLNPIYGCPIPEWRQREGEEELIAKSHEELYGEWKCYLNWES